MPIQQVTTARCDREGCNESVDVATVHDVPEGWYKVQQVRNANGSKDFSIFHSLLCVEKWSKARRQYEQGTVRPGRSTVSPALQGSVELPSAAELERLGYGSAALTRPDHLAGVHLRQRILRLLEEMAEEVSTPDIAELMEGVNPGALKHHLEALVRRGLLEQTHHGDGRWNPSRYRVVA